MPTEGYIENLESAYQSKDFRLVRIQGDGNCLYRSIATGIRRPEDFSRLREAAVDMMTGLEPSEFWPEEIILDNMIRQSEGAYGEELSIFALAIRLQRHIVVWNERGGRYVPVMGTFGTFGCEDLHIVMHGKVDSAASHFNYLERL